MIVQIWCCCRLTLSGKSSWSPSLELKYFPHHQHSLSFTGLFFSVALITIQWWIEIHTVYGYAFSYNFNNFSLFIVSLPLLGSNFLRAVDFCLVVYHVFLVFKQCLAHSRFSVNIFDCDSPTSVDFQYCTFPLIWPWLAALLIFIQDYSKSFPGLLRPSCHSSPSNSVDLLASSQTKGRSSGIIFSAFCSL